MSRRIGVRGRRVQPRRAPYSPTLDTNILDALRPSLLADGAVAAAAGIKGILSFTQGTAGRRPTKGSTSINSRPGLSFDGGDVLVDTGLGPAMATYAKITIVFAYVDTDTGLRVPFNNDGALGTDRLEFVTNDSGGAGHFEGLVSGTGWKSAPGAFATPVVTSIGFDLTADRGIVYLRQAGVSLTLTDRGSAVTAGGTWAFSNFFLGAFDGSATLGCSGVFGPIVFCTGLLAAGSAELTAIEQWVGREVGL